MNYTPRQCQAFVFLAAKRRQSELRDALYLNALAAQGDAKAIRNQMREMAE